MSGSSIWRSDPSSSPRWRTGSSTAPMPSVRSRKSPLRHTSTSIDLRTPTSTVTRSRPGEARRLQQNLREADNSTSPAALTYDSPHLSGGVANVSVTCKSSVAGPSGAGSPACPRVGSGNRTKLPGSHAELHLQAARISSIFICGKRVLILLRVSKTGFARLGSSSLWYCDRFLIAKFFAICD